MIPTRHPDGAGRGAELTPIPGTRSEGPPTSVRTVFTLGEVASLFDDDVNVVIYRPSVALEQVREARALLERRDLLFQRAVAAGSARPMLAEHWDDCPHLARAVGAWCEVLADLTGCPSLGVRLSRLDRAMCPRLHVDRITVRAVVTFTGPGTEVVPNAFVDRRHLGHASGGEPDERSGVLRSGAIIQRAEPFDAVWLKGESWPGNGGRGAVHRSPAASTSAPRLVLTLDALA